MRNMERCDFQIIEGCGVYSYTVEYPTHAKTKKSPAAAKVKTRKKATALKKRTLTILLLLLSPVAFLLDVAFAAVSYLPRKLYLLAEKSGRAGVIGTVSCFVILSAVLLTVL